MRWRIVVLSIGLLALVVPTPARWVERVYARGFYPELQRRVTALSNGMDLALFDPFVTGFVLGLLLWWGLQIRRARASSARGRVFRQAALDTLVLFSVAYLVFLVTWGFNYRRQPLRERVEFRQDRITRIAVLDTTRATIAQLNELWHRVARADWPALEELPAWMGEAFHAAETQLGTPPAFLGRPKASVFGFYFRRSAVDGMTDPFFLEILINPDLLPFERPFVVAHEWAHLAGHAEESEANFIGWLACLQGDIRAQYSGWLALYPYLLRSLSDEERRAVASELSPGPRRHLSAIAERLARASPLVRRTAARAYDQFLKANRVDAGIASYDEVVSLVIGTRFSPLVAPRQ